MTLPLLNILEIYAIRYDRNDSYLRIRRIKFIDSGTPRGGIKYDVTVTSLNQLINQSPICKNRQKDSPAWLKSYFRFFLLFFFAVVCSSFSSLLVSTHWVSDADIES